MSGVNDLSSLLAGISGGNLSGTTALVTGTCLYRKGAWIITRGGVELPAIWLKSASPAVGPCLLAMQTAPYGQTTVFVLGMTQETAPVRDFANVTRTSYGTDRCDIQFEDGTQYIGARHFTHHTPTLNDKVLVLWRRGEPFVIAEMTAPASFPELAMVREPNMPVTVEEGSSGRSQFPPTSFTMFESTLGYMNSRSREVRLTPTQVGIWSYGEDTRSLADKTTITSVDFTLGPRRVNDEGAVALTFSRSDANLTDSGGPTMLDGPWRVTLPKNYAGQPLSLPVAFGEALKQGGTITVKSSAPVSFLDSPGSGHVNVNWSK